MTGIETATIPEVAILLGILGLITYVSLDYKYIFDAMPIYLLGISMIMTIFWAIELVTYEMALMAIGVNAIGLILLIMIKEVGI